VTNYGEAVMTWETVWPFAWNSCAKSHRSWV